MNRYRLSLQPETLVALRRLHTGIRSIAISPGHPRHPGCSACYFETVTGDIVKILSESRDLEFKFEVFTLEAKLEAGPDDLNWELLDWVGPITVTLLETDEWIESTARSGEAIGANPVEQIRDHLSRVPATASAACVYVGGIEVTNSEGGRLFLATGGFPLSLHVQGYAEDPDVRIESYRHQSAA